MYLMNAIWLNFNIWIKWQIPLPLPPRKVIHWLLWSLIGYRYVELVLHVIYINEYMKFCYMGTLELQRLWVRSFIILFNFNDNNKSTFLNWH